jgi:hypothetical protein
MLVEGTIFAVLAIFTIIQFFATGTDVSGFVTIFIFGLIVLGIFWVYFHPDYIFTGGGIPPTSLSQFQLLVVSHLFMRAMAYMLLGLFLGNYLTGKTSETYRKYQLREIALTTQTLENFSRFSFLIIVVFIMNNFKLLLDRDTYLFAAHGSVNGALRYLVPVFGLLALYLIFQGISRILSTWTFILVLIIEFAASSRSLGILLLCFGAFWGLKSRSKFYGFCKALVFLVLSSSAISLVLQLRGQERNGLLPNLRFLEQSSFSNLNLTTVLGTFLVIIPVTVFGMRVPTPDAYFATSFNPLPGSMTNWYSMAPSLNLNPWTPTGGVAQVHNLGSLKDAITWILIGLTSQILANLSKRSRIPNIATMVLLILNLSASLQFLQYSIRAGFRFLYADIAFLVLLRFVKIHVPK